MALVINTNVASLTAQTNVNSANNRLNKSLQRLSSGLKINSGADGPAALVISQVQLSQLVGLQTAINNTSKAGSLVQTAEGALNEINNLLAEARGLALDSANTGVNDATAMAANQQQLQNILDTIDRIAQNTQFGTKHMLDGSAGINGSTGTAGVTFLRATAASTTGTFALNVSTPGEKANVEGATAQTAALAQDEVLTINGVQIALGAGLTQAQVIQQINLYSGQTGVTADAGGTGGATRLISAQFGSGASIIAQSNVATAANSSGIGTTVLNDSGVDIAGTIGGVAASGIGNVLTGITGATAGVSVSFGLDVGSETTTLTGAQGDVTILDQSLVFQIGANANQTATVIIGSVATTALGINVAGNQFSSLHDIDIQTASGAQDSIAILDQATNEVSVLRGTLGAFQAETLQSTANNLQATLVNTTSALSVIRDTDFAAETANFTKEQVLVQAGTSVLSSANQLSGLVLQLLQGL